MFLRARAKFCKVGKLLEKSWKKSEKSWCFPEKIRKEIGRQL